MAQSYHVRYASRVLRDFGDAVMKQLSIAIIAAIVVIAAQYHYGVFASEVFRANALSAMVPYIYILIAFFIYHAVHAAFVIRKELGEQRPRTIILITDSSPTYSVARAQWVTNGIATVFCVSLLMACWLLWEYAPPVVAVAKSVPVSDEALREVELFFGGLDESSLRDLFAFPTMLQTNIRMVTDSIIAYRKTGKREFDVRPYSDGGQMLLDSTLAGAGRVQRRGGGFTYDVDPNELGLIILPRKYVESKNILTSLENSSRLPLSVISELKEFDTAITENANLLLHVLHDCLLDSPDYYLRRLDVRSPYYGVIDGLYFDRFIQLKPKADKIRDSIRVARKLDLETEK